MSNSVLLDTSFLIALRNDKSDLNSLAKEYFDYFMQEKYNIWLSAIVLAEFNIKDKLEITPVYPFLKPLPFLNDHAILAAKKQRHRHESSSKESGKQGERDSVKDDFKIIAQVEHSGISFLASSDTKMNTQIIKSIYPTHCPFKFLDIHFAPNVSFGELF